MRFSIILLTLLFVFGVNAVEPAAALTPSRDDSVVIEKRTIVILRKGKFVKDFPERRKAVINYPFIKGGLGSAAVLRKVRALLQFKNIFDTTLAEYRADTWLDEFNYKVNYNRNFILDITFEQNGMGAYPDGQTKNFAISLKTGELIKARDIFKPEALNTLAAMVDKKLREENRRTIEESTGDAALMDDDKERLNALKFETANLDDLSISDKGVTFLFDAGFPHVIQALEPAGQYFFSYSELRPYIKPDGPVGVLAR